MKAKFECLVEVEFEDAEDAAWMEENFRRAFESRVIGSIPGGRINAAEVGDLTTIGPENGG